MAGRGPTTFQKRQKEQQRKEKRLNKLARREERRLAGPDTDSPAGEDLDHLDRFDGNEIAGHEADDADVEARIP